MSGLQLDTISTEPVVVVAALDALRDTVVYWTETPAAQRALDTSAGGSARSKNADALSKSADGGTNSERSSQQSKPCARDSDAGDAATKSKVQPTVFVVSRSCRLSPASSIPALGDIVIGADCWYRAEGGALCSYSKTTRARSELVSEDIACVFQEYADEPDFVLVKLLSGRPALYDANAQSLTWLRARHRAIAGSFSQRDRKIAIYHMDSKVRIYDFSNVPNTAPKAITTITTGSLVPTIAIMNASSLVYTCTISNVAEFIQNPSRTTSICRYNFGLKRPDGPASKRNALISRVEVINDMILYYDEFTERWMSDGYALPSVYKPTKDGIVAIYNTDNAIVLVRSADYGVQDSV